MSRRIVVLAAAALGVFAAGAGAAGPPGGGDIQPVNPPAVGLCAQLPHPTPACSAVTVACPSANGSEIACRTTGSTGPANADVRRLGLQLPRSYAKAVLSCRAAGDVRVTCRLVSRTLVARTGVHVAAMTLPQSFKTVRVSCTSRTKLACVVKKTS